ncbi:MAG: CoA activase [Proteobacteria bacterium]|nr:CoA activase [Pseudomonadota bacterium]
MSYFCGVDIGSTAVKVALLTPDGALAASAVAACGGRFRENAARALEGLLSSRGLAPADVRYTVSTGYGRKLFGAADEYISEITANALGAVAPGAEAPRARTIINIGGQDLKIILLDRDGHVNNFAMNDKCAAGTGRFLEMAARNLEFTLETLGDAHRRCADPPVTINSTCTVFAESEIISLLAAGHSRESIVAGIHYSIARRIARLARRVGVEDPVVFDGGPALNGGLVAAVQDELMREVRVTAAPQITTAVGAARAALESWPG